MWDHSHEHWQLPGVCPPHGRLVLLLSSYQVSLAPQSGVGPYTPSSIHARMLTGLVLLRQPQPLRVCVSNNCIMPQRPLFTVLLPVFWHLNSFQNSPHQIILGSNASSKEYSWLRQTPFLFAASDTRKTACNFAVLQIAGHQLEEIGAGVGPPGFNM